MNRYSDVSGSTAARWLIALAVLALPLLSSASSTAPVWIEETVGPSVTVKGKTYQTGCAFAQDSDYRYFIQNSETSSNLLFFLDGGGACWDPNTCGLNPPVEPTFLPTITEYVDNGRLVDAAVGSLETGILEDNDNNPFQGYTKVFVPYCTGDVFWGNKDKNYGPGTIRHRGYGNLLAMFESLWSEQGYAIALPDRIVIAGVSGGAYGAIAAFIEVEKRLPKWRFFNNHRNHRNHRTTLTYLIADSGNSIVINDFLHRAINAPDAAWGVRENGGTLPGYMLNALQDAFGLPVKIYGELAWRHLKSRFGQIQNAYDLVQGRILNIMKHVEQPLWWDDPTYLLPSLAEWTVRMRTAVNVSAAAPNYRFYTAAGSEHTVLIDIPPNTGFGFCSDLFYEETSAASVKLTDWVRDMVNTPNLWSTGEWRNATCFPNCLNDPTSRCPVAINP